MIIEYVEIPKRLQNIAKLRESGKTFREIGEEFNISIERARQLYKKYLAMVEFNKKMDETLSKDSLLKCLYLAQQELNSKPALVTRTYNGIRRAGYDDDQILSSKYSDEHLLTIRNFGIKSLELINRAVDIRNKMINGIY